MRPVTDQNATSDDFQRGWDAAIQAVRFWHEAQAKRSRFPKNLERDAEVHTRCAEQVATLSPDDA